MTTPTTAAGRPASLADLLAMAHDDVHAPILLIEEYDRMAAFLAERGVVIEDARFHAPFSDRVVASEAASGDAYDPAQDVNLAGHPSDWTSIAPAASGGVEAAWEALYNAVMLDLAQRAARW